ncbi:MAG: InlB B-repeat-containing protein, partial [Bacteroidales bacterium]|nr:InlB B-repeat-containing protein [Bacteroidales bacterium]
MIIFGLPTQTYAVTAYLTFNDYACFASQNPGKTPGHVTIIRSIDGVWSNPNNIGCGWADIIGNVTNLAIGCGSTDGYFFIVFNNNDYMQATGVTTSPCDFYTSTGYISSTGSFYVTASCTMPDDTPPVIQSAATNTLGTEITLTYDEDISTSYPVLDDFTVKVNNVVRPVSNVSYSGSTCILTVSPAITSDQTVTVSYDNSYSQIADNIGNAAASLTNYPVTNNASPGSTSTITFNSNGGSAVAPITQDEGTPVAAPADPTRAGFTFMGWVPAVPATMPVDDITCTAQWTANQSTITFNSAGGSAVAPITQDEGTPVAAPADPTRAGFTFMG